MKPTAPDLQLVPEVTKDVPVPAADSGYCRTVVTAVVAISMAILTLGVLSGKWQEEGLVLRVGTMQKDIPSVKGPPSNQSRQPARTSSEVQEYVRWVGSSCGDQKEQSALWSNRE